MLRGRENETKPLINNIKVSGSPSKIRRTKFSSKTLYVLTIIISILAIALFLYFNSGRTIQVKPNFKETEKESKAKEQNDMKKIKENKAKNLQKEQTEPTKLTEPTEPTKPNKSTEPTKHTENSKKTGKESKKEKEFKNFSYVLTNISCSSNNFWKHCDNTCSFDGVCGTWEYKNSDILCCSEYHWRHLLFIDHVAKKYNDQTWGITYGTLLGAIQNQDIFPWTTDIDLSIDPNFIKILKNNNDCAIWKYMMGGEEVHYILVARPGEDRFCSVKINENGNLLMTFSGKKGPYGDIYEFLGSSGGKTWRIIREKSFPSFTSDAHLLDIYQHISTLNLTF